MSSIKQIIAMGGGGFSMEPENPLLDVYVISWLLEKDVIYVGGGSTRSMLALCREWGLERILRKAYEEGIVLAGISAGANCWFEQCSTDSMPWPARLSAWPCLAILKGSFCPHYDGEVDRRPTVHQFLQAGSILPGYAADDGAAAHFVDDSFSLAVSSRPHARVYRLGRTAEGAVSEEALPTRYLGA